MHRLFITDLACLISVSLFGQISGCTDQNAFNFNESATNNDGSCCYENINTNQVGQSLIGNGYHDYFGSTVEISDNGNVIAIVYDGNLDGCSNAEDLINMLSVYGQCE